MEARDLNIGVAGDPIYAATLTITPSERDMYIRGIYAPEYRADLRRLMYLSIDGPEDDE
jgi:N-formylglutamate amidohydrolase